MANGMVLKLFRLQCVTQKILQHVQCGNGGGAVEPPNPPLHLPLDLSVSSQVQVSCEQEQSSGL